MRFTIKQIAAQAGVSKATVDRALHGRGSVHAQTERRIKQAIGDLEIQERTSLASGRTIPLDVILHTPERFSRLVCDALIDEISHFAPFRLKLRFHCFETISTKNMRKLMLRCANDSYGIILKAENNITIYNNIVELKKYHVPVVTMVTYIPNTKRLCYAGMNNNSAGKTAAYLMSEWLERSDLDVAVILSSQKFLGEKERVDAFCERLKALSPKLRTIPISEGYGMDVPTFDVVKTALDKHPNIKAVYCVGGGNAAIIRAFHASKRKIQVYIAHDVDQENRQLMEQHKINAVIENNLNYDARVVFQTLLAFHGFVPISKQIPLMSKVNVVTPYNM